MRYGKKPGNLKLGDLTREWLIQFGKDRAREGASPAAISMDIGYVKLVVSHAAAVHGIRIQVEPTDPARVALKRDDQKVPFLDVTGWKAEPHRGLVFTPAPAPRLSPSVPTG